MWSLENCIKKKIRSASSGRLPRGGNKIVVDASKFMYIGENPEKKPECFFTEHRYRVQEPDFRFTNGEKTLSIHTLLARTSSKIRYTPNSRVKRKSMNNEKTNEKISFFKRKAFREPIANENAKNAPNFYIDQLISVPIAERKIIEKVVIKASPLRDTRSRNECRTIQKKVIENKFTNTNGVPCFIPEPIPIVVYCDPLTIDETESPSLTFKPRYL